MAAPDPSNRARATLRRWFAARPRRQMCERGEGFHKWQLPARSLLDVSTQLRDNYYVRSLGGHAAWNAPEGALRPQHLLAAARTLARFDIVMTVATLERDARAQMRRVGHADLRPRHIYERSRAENLQRAADNPRYRIAAKAACEVPPTAAQLRQLVAASAWDAVLYEFARVLAARRTAAYSEVVARL
jgi:hypothetical protein